MDRRVHLKGGEATPRVTARRLAVCAVLAVLALWPMLLVSTPIVYFDSEAYVSAGERALSLIRPAPATAGAEGGGGVGGGAGGLRSASWSLAVALLGGMPWGAVLLLWVQTFLTLALLSALVPRGMPPGRAAIGAAILLLATGLPWYAAYAMPDLLGATVLAYYALLAAPGAWIGRRGRWAAAAVATFAILGHYGHLPLAAILAVVVSVVAVRRGDARGPTIAAAIVPLVAALAFNAAVSVAVDRVAAPRGARAEAPGVPSVAPGRMPVLLARAIEDGPARLHLTEACERDAYRSCAFLPDPLPETVGGVLWNATSGFASFTPDQRRILRAEEMRIVLDAARAHPGAQVAALTRNAGRQFVRVGLSQHLPRPDGPGERPSAKDHAAHPVLPVADRLVPIPVWTGAAVLGVLLALGRLPPGLGAPLAVVLVGLLANAAIFGGLSYPVDRYQGRIAWLLPALAVLAVLSPKRAGRRE